MLMYLKLKDKNDKKSILQCEIIMKEKHPDVTYIWKYVRAGTWKKVPVLKKNDIGQRQAELQSLNRTIYNCKDKK